MLAKSVAFCVKSLSQTTSLPLGSCLNLILPVLDFKSEGSHKYVPEDWINEQLQQPAGGGVWGYIKMQDDSYILRLCNGLATWGGSKEEPPELV